MSREDSGRIRGKAEGGGWMREQWQGQRKEGGREGEGYIIGINGRSLVRIKQYGGGEGEGEQGRELCSRAVNL